MKNFKIQSNLAAMFKPSRPACEQAEVAELHVRVVRLHFEKFPKILSRYSEN